MATPKKKKKHTHIRNVSSRSAPTKAQPVAQLPTRASAWCPTCKANVHLMVHATSTRHGGFDRVVEYVFGECVACRGPALVRYEGRQGVDALLGTEEPRREQLYPSREMTRARLPKSVREPYEEAINAHWTGSKMSAVVMVGRTLEAIAVEFKAHEGTLYQAIDKLKEDGVISPELADWGHELRGIRNQGAHAADPVTVEDASAAIQFLNAIVETLFYLRPKFAERRASRQKKGGP